MWFLTRNSLRAECFEYFYIMMITIIIMINNIIISSVFLLKGLYDNWYPADISFCRTFFIFL